MYAILILTLGSLLPRHAMADDVKPAESGRRMAITYGSPSWNADSKKIDTAFLVIRDKKTGKMMQVQIEETEPDSSQFAGRFFLAVDADDTPPEIFVPPQGQRGEKDYRKIYESIQSGALVRKPVIWKKSNRGQSIIDVYDTREQAEQALKAYQEETRLAQDMKQKSLVKPVASEATLEAARQAERKAQLDKMALEAAKRETDRLRMEQIEKQKAEERERLAKQLTEQEKASRRVKAQKIADEGTSLYADGNFSEAEKKFAAAVDLDPENRSYYFKYGVTLYRNQKFNEALVVLKLAEVDPKTDLERKYYMGLVHYRLAELDAAAKVFAEVASSQDPVMAPSAHFYHGVILFAQEKFEPAKKSFETVIDISNDPRLDEQAEEYLDRVASALMYQKLRENKWSVSGTVGLMYDSNLLLAQDNAADQGAATAISDLRVLTAGEVGYRPIFNEHHEWTPAFNASLTNSNLTDAASKTAATQADPWLYNLALPYSYKGMAFKKGYKLTAKPGYEVLYMDAEGTGTKRLVLASYFLSVDNTFVMTKDWFSTYTLEYRQDDSRTADSTGPNDADAAKITVRTTQSVFLEKGRKEAIVSNLGYVTNAAKGTEKKYNRIDLGAMYVRPIPWDASLNFGLSAYKLYYPKASEIREDTNVTLTTGLSKPIREWVTWGVIGSYTRNNSTQSENTYTKYLIMTTATFNTSF